MNTTSTLINSMNFVSEKEAISNESILEIYEHVKIIEKSEIWKKSSFYVGSPKHLHILKEKKFGAFIKEVYGRSRQWYKSMESFLNLENGKELFIKYGHKNMAAYLNFSPYEREHVLKIASKLPTANFHYILDQSGLRGAQPIVKNTTEIEWKKKYDALKKKYDKLQQKYIEVKAENTKLKGQLKRVQRSLT